MSKLNSLILALPLVAMGASSALAVDANLTGDWTITIPAARGIPQGTSLCLTLTQTGGVLGFKNSGTISSGGTVVGNYYAFQSVLVAEAENIFLTGHLYHRTISNTSVTVFGQNGISGVGSFTVAKGCAE